MIFPRSFLLSDTAADQRMISRKPAFVIHAHTERCAGHEFVELDADDRDHADRLADHWCQHGMAIYCHIRRVFPDGRLGVVIATTQAAA